LGGVFFYQISFSFPFILFMGYIQLNSFWGVKTNTAWAPAQLFNQETIPKKMLKR